MQAYVMVGAPGSGKSTYAAKLAGIENAIIISGDDICADLHGPAVIQGNWGEIWDRIEELVSESCGMPVILDGPHCRPDYRAEAVALLRSYGYEEIEAVVMETPLAKCLERNSQRQRQVPDHVIKQMHSDLTRSLETIQSEPFTRWNFIF